MTIVVGPQEPKIRKRSDVVGREINGLNMKGLKPCWRFINFSQGI